MYSTHLSERNFSRVSARQDIDDPYDTTKDVNSSGENQELTNFENETKRLFQELMEKQRQELSVFDRNYRLDNQKIVDEATQFYAIQDVDTREKVMNQSYRIKHEYNVGKSKILRKQQKEQNDFWRERNELKKQLYSQYDINPATGYQSRPRSVFTSRSVSRTTSRNRTPMRSAEQFNVEDDTVTFGDDATRESSFARSAVNFDEPRRVKIQSKQSQRTSAFFMPRYSTISNKCKYGNFSRLNGRY